MESVINFKYEDFVGTFDIHRRDFEGFQNCLDVFSHAENSSAPPLPPIHYLAAQGGGEQKEQPMLARLERWMKRVSCLI